MKIYVDFDDCLCETAKSFSDIIADLFGIVIPYEGIKYFNLQKAFSLSDEDYKTLMVKGHQAETLLSLEETPGASEAVNAWIDKGYDVSIITGRPFDSYEPSRIWLDQHDLERVKLYCLNKYSRDGFYKNSEVGLELEDYYKMHFDFAVEDSPSAYKFFDHLPDLKVLVFDRPWNREDPFPNENYSRVPDWEKIREIVG